ncbi:hypothetical protein ACQB60_10430 [Actinomycetota bacterium Odt1-20B]
MITRTKAALLGTGMATALSLLALTPAPATAATSAAASASAQHGCAWPNVCFYKTKADYNRGRVAASYKDITSRFQTLGPQSRGADVIYNTRKDDRVVLRLLNHGQSYVACMKPKEVDEFGPGLTVIGVMIQDKSNCPPTP